MDGEGWEWDGKEARKLLMAACVTFSKLYYSSVWVSPSGSCSREDSAAVQEGMDGGFDRFRRWERGHGKKVEEMTLTWVVWTLTLLPPNLQLLIPQSWLMLSWWSAIDSQLLTSVTLLSSDPGLRRPGGSASGVTLYHWICVHPVVMLGSDRLI